jgi:hypothetical protein
MDVFFDNIERRIQDIAVQARHASVSGISNQAKSGYYRFAILLACTIAEGLLFHIVKKKVDENGGVMGECTSLIEPYQIPNRYAKHSVDETIVFCVSKKSQIRLSNQTKFNDLISYANKNGIITKLEKVKIEKIMRLRNKIHLQSLSERDNGYTKKRLNKVFDVINLLLNKG